MGGSLTPVNASLTIPAGWFKS